MLTAAPSFAVNYDHLSVFFPFSARARIATQMRLARAKNPFGAVPPEVETLVKLASLAPSTKEQATLGRLLIEVAASTGRYEDRVKSLQASDTFSSLLRFASWLTVGAQVTPAQDYLFADPIIRLHLNSLCDLHELGAEEPVTNGHPPETDQGYLSPTEATSLLLLTIWCSYPKLMDSYLTRPEETPAGSPKDVYPMMVRVQRLMDFMVIARHSVELAGLREHALLLLSPMLRPFLDLFNARTRDELISMAEQVTQIKLHPCLAASQNLCIPARRATQWGKQNYTMGLATSKRGATLWDKLHNWMTVRSDNATDMRDMILDKSPTGLVMSFFSRAEALMLQRKTLNPDNVRLAEGVLGLTLPSAPPTVHLGGQEWRPIFMTGAEASTAFGLDDMLLRPRFPLLDADGSAGQVMGGTTAFEYDAAVWDTGADTSHYQMNALERPQHVPPLFVRPHRPDILNGYHTGQLMPEMFKPVTSSEYFGDDDADFAVYEIDAFARKMGYKDAQQLLHTPHMADRIGHLFTLDTGAKGKVWVKAVPSATRIFKSTRTEQPWLKPVDVPADVIPSETLAMDRVTAPIAGPVQSVIIRDRTKPVLTNSSLGVGDELAAEALKMLGADIR